MLPIRAGERPFPVVAQSCSAPSVSRNCRIAAEQGQRTLHPGTEGRRTPLRGVLHQSPDAVGREREFERLDTEIRESGGDRVGDHTADGKAPAFHGALRHQRMLWREEESHPMGAHGRVVGGWRATGVGQGTLTSATVGSCIYWKTREGEK